MPNSSANVPAESPSSTGWTGPLGDDHDAASRDYQVDIPPSLMRVFDEEARRPESSLPAEPAANRTESIFLPSIEFALVEPERTITEQSQPLNANAVQPVGFWSESPESPQQLSGVAERDFPAGKRDLSAIRFREQRSDLEPPRFVFSENPGPTYGGRQSIQLRWVAANLRYRRPYFEEIVLERHGFSKGPLYQPVFSTARFFSIAAFMPAIQTVWSDCQIFDHRAYGHSGSNLTPCWR